MTENSDKSIDAQSDKMILSLIGNFIKEIRLEQRWTQQDLADASGIARSTLTSLESGAGGTILSLVQILRTLDQLALFNQFQVVPKISPLALARQAQQKRKRAR